MPEGRAITIGLFFLSATAGSIGAQGLTPTDDKEAARFESVAGAVARAGFGTPLVVGHGSGAADALFAVLVTRRDSGLLVITTEPAAGATAKPVVLEREESAPALGIRDVAFAPFLDAAGLWDILVRHQPFMLEISRRFDTHHVVRLTGGGVVGTVAPICEFAGTATTSSSKAVGTQGSVRRVTVAAVAGAPMLTFTVTTVDETVSRGARDTVNTVTPVSTVTTRYTLPPTGMCKTS